MAAERKESISRVDPCVFYCGREKYVTSLETLEKGGPDNVLLTLFTDKAAFEAAIKYKEAPWFDRTERHVDLFLQYLRSPSTPLKANHFSIVLEEAAFFRCDTSALKLISPDNFDIAPLPDINISWQWVGVDRLDPSFFFGLFPSHFKFFQHPPPPNIAVKLELFLYRPYASCERGNSLCSPRNRPTQFSFSHLYVC